MSLTRTTAAGPCVPVASVSRVRGGGFLNVLCREITVFRSVRVTGLGWKELTALRKPWRRGGGRGAQQQRRTWRPRAALSHRLAVLFHIKIPHKLGDTPQMNGSGPPVWRGALLGTQPPPPPAPPGCHWHKVLLTF